MTPHYQHSDQPEVLEPSTMSRINVPLLRKTLEHITAHPTEWNQEYWGRTFNNERDEVCGTAYCLAGHAVVMTGHTLTFSNGGYSHFTDQGEEIGEVAERELGLTYDEAYELFHDQNSLFDLWELAEQFTDGEIVNEHHPSPDGHQHSRTILEGLT